eukprot:COSAG02_NODE_4377_length_5435_cov_3.316342_5_plen_86_part_00
MQRDFGGIVGIEGPGITCSPTRSLTAKEMSTEINCDAGWSRINSHADNGLGLNYLPRPIFDEFCDEERFGPLERVRQTAANQCHA